MPTSVLRRYTPPTCTLEVAANRSALSRWADQTVLRDVQFRLTVSNPDEPTQEVQVTGDRNQLEDLGEAVQTYVQGLLQVDGEPQNPALRHLLPTPSTEMAPARAASTAPAANLIAFPTVQPLGTDSGIHLEAKGLLAHDLHLGSLANDTSGPILRLSTVQLFDLANALDEYAAESLALPTLGRSPMTAGRWVGIAATFLLALGATGGIAKFLLDIGTPTTVATDSADELETAASPEAPPDFGIVSTLPTSPQPSPTPGTLVPPPGSPGAAQAGRVPFPSGSLFGNNNIPQQQPPRTGDQFANIPPQRIPAQGGQAGMTQVPPDPQNLDSSSVSISQAPDLPMPNGAAPSTLSEAATGESSSLAAAPPSSHRSLGMPSPGDLSQQINEIQAYFQDSWNPPDNLNDTLEYRVLIGADGRIEQIVPMGDVAGLYLDRTGMPLLGESFVSPLQPYQQALVRVVLAPDGRVQTFLEGRN